MSDERATSYALWPGTHARRQHATACSSGWTPVADETLLDLGCGPGAMARAAGPFVKRVVLCDLSPAMLRVAATESRRAGRPRAVTGRGGRERAAVSLTRALPELVACRHAARLFRSPEGFASEVARVLRQGGRVAVCDVMATGEPEAG